MKERISATLDKEIIAMLVSLEKNRKFRNRSHIVEIAIAELKKSEDRK